MKKMIDQPGTILESKFKISYGIILNLLNADEFNVQDMMKRSFSENSKFEDMPKNLEKLQI